jgi:hypothetical protein
LIIQDFSPQLLSRKILKQTIPNTNYNKRSNMKINHWAIEGSFFNSMEEYC